MNQIIVYMDECSFHFDNGAVRGWQRSNKRLNQIHKPKSKNYTLVGACTENGLEALQFIYEGI